MDVGQVADERPPGEPGASGDVIVLDAVRKEFGNFVAVEEASFSIERGEFFSMLGPSGCGKTTLLKIIAGFEQPTSGKVLLDGVDVSDVPPHKRNVNTVFQQYALFPHMSIVDNVAFGLRAKKVPARRRGGGRSTCSTSSSWPSSPIAARPSSPAASSSESPSPAPSSTCQPPCCSTSPSRPST